MAVGVECWAGGDVLLSFVQEATDPRMSVSSSSIPWSRRDVRIQGLMDLIAVASICFSGQAHGHAGGAPDDPRVRDARQGACRVRRDGDRRVPHEEEGRREGHAGDQPDGAILWYVV